MGHPVYYGDCTFDYNKCQEILCEITKPIKKCSFIIDKNPCCDASPVVVGESWSISQFVVLNYQRGIVV